MKTGCLTFAVLTILMGSLPTFSFGAESVTDERAAIDADFVEKLAELAAVCDKHGLKDQAAITRGYVLPNANGKRVIYTPTGADVIPISARSPEIVSHWRRHLATARAKYASELYDVAKAGAEDDPIGSYQMLHEVLRHDPNHALARRTLALPITPPRIVRRPGGAGHPLWKWRGGAYWRVESEHFEIVTNHSVKEGVALAERLENLHAVWSQVFFLHWSSAAELQRAFAVGGSGLGATRKFDNKYKVVLFKDKPEYLRQLSTHVEGIEVSEGYYAPARQESYFYVGYDVALRAQLHEATHQLFQQNGEAVEQPGERSNFWIVEGVAMYMESLSQREGYVTLGGFDAHWPVNAKARSFGDGLVPLEQFVSLSRVDVQQSGDIRALYSQSAGVTHFLLDGDRQTHRDAFLRCLQAVYAGRDTKTMLAEQTSDSFADLSKAYVAYLKRVNDEE